MEGENPINLHKQSSEARYVYYTGISKHEQISAPRARESQPPSLD